MRTLTSKQHLTTVTSPSRPRLITISPRTPSSKTSLSQPATPAHGFPRALVSAFSPDTPPETPDVPNRSKINEDPTYEDVKACGLGSLGTNVRCPITPPNSRVPTPFDKIASSACLRKHSRWAQASMTQLDPITAWILCELEVLLADFPTTVLRLNSPVVQRIRSVTSGRGQSARQRSSTAPHSRYSPYRPLSSHPTSPRSPRHNTDDTIQSASSQDPQADPTAFALRTIFPNARPHHLDSLQANYLALHYIVNLPSSEFVTASASDTASSPFAVAARISRSSSVVSNVPPKARAMLGLDSSPLQRSPTPPVPPSPAKSWFRASSPELDSALKTRLENVELLLETSVRKVLVDIQGRALGKQDDALMRAVGEVVRMGERRSGDYVF
ncbi:MAG: hypothetical protein Q9201_000997 [Fulgogasparrea decipioides]